MSNLALMALGAAPDAPTAPAKRKVYRHACPECAVSFTGPRDARFCSAAHKDAFHNRSAKRGKVAIPLVMAWRGGRGSGPSAKYAFAELCALADIWNAEDRAAGRLPMASFIAPKMREGWTATDLPSLPKLQARKAN